MPSTTPRAHAPPPPPPPAIRNNPAPAVNINPPSVPSVAPPDALMVELLVYNGAPFKDHWAYWVCSRHDKQVGVLIHATGDVRNGFRFQAKRSYDFRYTTNPPIKRVPLQWVSAQFFDENAMLNWGDPKDDYMPVGPFEISAHRVNPPREDNEFRGRQGKFTS
ncbi:hypothetical protein NUU61_007006 [Penicillium alfredii]|uniref:Uncharacterized protein n=1 Tax=Penicillium alfredii TaxID=1506179 RepID=A0A9W9F236_9EURO|nr:uncharacterized protein NUU61_007006 [Penicillium alfredii]KAJ5092136.1 hypothetical protein NUU61_007006 [Penicillium alfredii]